MEKDSEALREDTCCESKRAKVSQSAGILFAPCLQWYFVKLSVSSYLCTFCAPMEAASIGCVSSCPVQAFFNSSKLFAQPLIEIYCVLLDIEGTTTPM